MLTSSSELLLALIMVLVCRRCLILQHDPLNLLDIFSVVVDAVGLIEHDGDVDDGSCWET
jgi:hypothetical protein